MNIIKGTCVCGNTSSFDEESLKGSTISVNGTDIVLCCNCEDELREKLNNRRGEINEICNTNRSKK